jgi:hypothetical protein
MKKITKWFTNSTSKNSVNVFTSPYYDNALDLSRMLHQIDKDVSVQFNKLDITIFEYSTPHIYSYNVSVEDVLKQMQTELDEIKSKLCPSIEELCKREGVTLPKTSYPLNEMELTGDDVKI